MTRKENLGLIFDEVERNRGINSPKFWVSESTGDWKVFVGQYSRAIWGELTFTQRLAIAYDAYDNGKFEK
jgi:hypothetical protein